MATLLPYFDTIVYIYCKLWHMITTVLQKATSIFRSRVRVLYYNGAKSEVLPKKVEVQKVSPDLRGNRMAVSALFFMHGLCFASWASRIPSIQENLSLSEGILGSILFALPVGFFLSLPFAGWLVGKIGSKRVAVPSAIFYSLSLVYIGLSGSVATLAISLFSFGFFANLLNISINTQAVLVEALYKKKLMASFHGLWSLAGFAGAAIGTWMIGNSVSPFNHYIFICIFFLVVNSICAFYLVNKDESSSEKRPLFAMPDKSLIGLGIIAFCSMMAEGAMFDWSGIYFSKVVRVDQELTGMGYTTFMIAMAGMRFMADYLSGNFGLKRILQASGLLTTVGLLLAVALPEMMPSLVGFFLIGMGVSAVVPLVYSAAGKSKTLSPGTALTAVSSLGFMGLLIGPPIIGFIADLSSLRISFLAITIMSMAVILLASRLPGEADKNNARL
jgi:MFS family permease